MSRFLSLGATSALVLVAVAVMASDSVASPFGDRIEVPPNERTFLSPGDGDYRLVIDTIAHEAKATLQFLPCSEEPRTLWTKTLPHRFGPRSVIVDVRGNVLLLDEWMKVTGDYAVMLIDVSGRVVATHGFHDVVAAAGGDDGPIIRESGASAWMSGMPELSDDGRSVVVPIGDTRLRISLDDGSLLEER